MVRWVNHVMSLMSLAIFAVELRWFVRSWWSFVSFVFQLRALGSVLKPVPDR